MTATYTLEQYVGMLGQTGLEEMVEREQYPTTEFPCDPTKDFLVREVEDFLRGSHVNWTASPGCPWAIEYSTIRDLVRNNYVEFVISVVDMLILWRDTPYEVVRNMTAVEHVQSGLFDPCRVMVKDEPHPMRKFESGKMRLVMSVSATVSVAMAVLHQRQNDAEVAANARCPAKPGMGLNQEGIRDVWEYVESKTGDRSRASNDASGWDWGVILASIMAETDLTIVLQRCRGTLWENMIRNASYLQAASLFVLSDGRLYALLLPGGVRSGGRKTASGNSHMRHLYSEAASFLSNKILEGHFAAAMGDDCVEGLIVDEETHVNLYKRLGVTLTDFLVGKRGDPFEFCSHMFYGPDVAIPTQWARTLYRLISKSYNQVDYEQWLDEMRHMSDPRSSTRLDDLVEFLRWARWLPTPVEAH
jgi:hypothetical protein